MLLGISTIDYLFRTTIPAGGLVILISACNDILSSWLQYANIDIVFVTAFSDSLVSMEKNDRERRMPEAPSPRMITTARSYATTQSDNYPPSRYEDLKAEQINSANAFVQPRSVPVPGVPQALPTTTNASGGTGVGGVPLTGQLFPPLRANTAPIMPPMAAAQRSEAKPSLLNSKKGPARSATVGGKAISGPQLRADGTNPLDKVATTDLVTAAQLERERREQQQAIQDRIAPVKRNTGVSPDQGLMMATNTVRKELVTPAVGIIRPESDTLATGYATGAQLSPQPSPPGDELRRRSPRRATSNASRTPSPKSSPKPSALSLKSVEIPEPPPKSPARALARPVPEPETTPPVMVKTIIRPSRQLPPSPEPQPEPAKTPLQRRPTAGLPGNPRALSVKKKPAEAAAKRAETVMFVNNIVYNDPTLVASVMEDAKDRGSKQFMNAPPAATSPVQTTMIERPTLSAGPQTANSVVHRPRPIPRKSTDKGEDAAYAPPQGHNRSASAGAVTRKSSILQSSSGEPPRLPPIPPPPPPPLENIRPLPNDTKSMTFDEKVKLLFPSTPNSASRPERPERRSSVPTLPASLLEGTATLIEEREAIGLGLRDSPKTRSSVHTRSIFSEKSQPERPDPQREESFAVYDGIISVPQQEEQPEESPIMGTAAGRNQGGKRASSPVLPIFENIMSATTMDDDWSTVKYADTILSPEPVQQVGLAVYPARARAIEVTAPAGKMLDNRAISAVTNSEEMTIMLDTSVAREVRRDQGDGSSSPVDDGSPASETTSTRSSGPWHRRVGEETLSFSMLSDRRSSRRGPPPTRLNLSDRPTQAKQIAMAKASEPSPLPSPEEALRMIQSQLKRYEDAEQAGDESPGRQELLNDLEKEMGQQETRWRGMHSEFARDSLSTLDLSPTAESRRASNMAASGVASDDQMPSRNSSTRSNLAAERRASRRARMTNAPSARSSMDFERMSLGTRASLWQKKLEEAQLEFAKTAQGLERKRSVNFLSLSQVGSPTPPDSDDSEQELETKFDLAALVEQRKKSESVPAAAAPEPSALWNPPKPAEDLIGLMWVRPEKPYAVPVIEPPLPGLNVRPAQRKEAAPLSINSVQLWEKAASNTAESDTGLWKSAKEIEAARNKSRPSFYKPGIQRSRTLQSSSRPLTQRPPRRSRRITALPDILEDPQPLPDKRDTLGIFQFPWGERSDLPMVPARPSFMAMPGTMSTGGSVVRAAIDARSRIIQQSEYSSSFFDDYDEEDEEKESGSSESSDMGSDSDDGFDESMLFEIASLLKASSSDIPSTSSFFGPSHDSVSRDSVDSLVANYIDNEPEDEALHEMPVLQQDSDSLWEETRTSKERGAHGKGLPQPDDWHMYDQVAETSRAKPRASEQPASVSSNNLWVAPPVRYDTSTSPMWSPPDSPATSSQSFRSSSSEIAASTGASPGSSTPEEAPISGGVPLWQVQAQRQKGEHGVGLPHPHDWDNYDKVKSTVRAKPRQAEPATVDSFDLWTITPPEAPSSPSKMWSSKDNSPAVSRPASPSQKEIVTEETKQSSPLLWSAPSSVEQTPETGLFDLTAYRTEYRTTSLAPAAANMERKSRSPVRKSADRLVSTTLWSSAPTSEAEKNWLAPRTEVAPKRLLWSEPASPKELASSGLFDLESGRTEFRTTSQEPAAIRMERKSRASVQKALDRLTSSSLWTAKSPTKAITNWISYRVLDRKTLWSAPASPRELEHCGLFDPSASRADFRTTSLAPAALETNRRARSPAPAGLKQLTSTSLWGGEAPTATEKNWLVVEKSRISPNALWSAPASPKNAAQNGLFDPAHERSDFRTTSLAPAALATDRRARSPTQEGLKQLTSTSLWDKEAPVAPEKNWLVIEKSASPKVLWSAPTSPKLAAQVGLFDPTYERSDFRTTVLAPAALDAPRRSRSPSPTPMDKLASDTLWAAKNTATTGRNWISVQTDARRAAKHAATPQQWQEALSEAVAASYPVMVEPRSRVSRHRVTPEQWQEALNEAIAASSPTHTVRKAPIKATPADWAAALAEAISKSFNKPSFDASNRHPVFAASSLTTNASIVHPAATGYTYNVAATHPVFFGSGAGKFVHPAAIPKKPVFDASKRHPVFAATSFATKATVLHPAATGYAEDVAAVHHAVQEIVEKPAAEISVSRSSSIRRAGGRISAMMSKFEEPATTSLSRSSSVSSWKRAPTPPRAATPEPVEEVQVAVDQVVVQEEFLQPVTYQAPEETVAFEDTVSKEAEVEESDNEMDPAILAQIEALEQERLFAEQWAAGNLDEDEDEDEEENVPSEQDGPLEPSPMIVVQSREPEPTPVERPAEISIVEDITHTPAVPVIECDVAPQTPVAQTTPASFDDEEEIDPSLFMPRDVTPATPLAPLAVVAPEPPRTPKTPETPKSSGGWLSSFTSRFGVSPPRAQAQIPPMPPMPATMEEHKPVVEEKKAVEETRAAETEPAPIVQLKRADTISLRDSRKSTHSEAVKTPTGSKIQFIY